MIDAQVRQEQEISGMRCLWFTNHKHLIYPLYVASISLTIDYVRSYIRVVRRWW
jgi:hypothetical protein